MIIIVGASLSKACGACSKRPVCTSEHTAMGTVSALWCVNCAAHSVELATYCRCAKWVASKVWADSRFRGKEAEEHVSNGRPSRWWLCVLRLCALWQSTAVHPVLSVCVHGLGCNQQLRCVFSHIPLPQQKTSGNNPHAWEEASADSRKALGEWAAEYVTLVANTALFANGGHFAHHDIKIYGKMYSRYICI